MADSRHGDLDREAASFARLMIRRLCESVTYGVFVTKSAPRGYPPSKGGLALHRSDVPWYAFSACILLGTLLVDVYIPLDIPVSRQGHISQLSALVGRTLKASRSGQPQVLIDICACMRCPRLGRYEAAIEEAIQVMERMRGSFKSKEIGTLREHLEGVLREGRR